MSNNSLVVPVKTNLKKTGNYQKFTEAHMAEVSSFLRKNEQSFKYILRLDPVQFDAVEVEGYGKLVDLSDIDKQNQYGGHMQGTRARGKNTKFSELRHSIHSNGFFLDNIPVVLYYDAETGRYIKITGSTRIEILYNAGFSNVPAIVLTAKTDDRDKIENNLSMLGNICNPAERPSAGAEMEDFVKEVTYAIRRGWCEADYDSVRNRIKLQDPTNGYTDTKLDSLTARVINAHMPGTFLSFTSSKQAQDWLHNQKYRTVEPKDGKRGIMYVAYNATLKKKAFVELANIAANNSEYDIRVVIYNPLITSSNPEATFVKRMEEWNEFWGSTIAKVSKAYFGNAAAHPVISIYGMIPYEKSMVETGFDKVIKREDWDELITAYRTSDDELEDLIEGYEA